MRQTSAECVLESISNLVFLKKIYRSSPENSEKMEKLIPIKPIEGLNQGAEFGKSNETETLSEFQSARGVGGIDRASAAI